MREHLETAPVWDAVRGGRGCPFCALRDMIEKQSVQRFLGGAVMQPDMRLRTNAVGFCAAHHRLLMAEKDYHGYALMMQTRLTEVRAQVEASIRRLPAQGGGRLFGHRGEALASVQGAVSRCLVCESIAEHHQKYLDTFLQLYGQDPAFREAFSACPGICLSDLPEVAEAARAKLSGPVLKEFLQTLSDTALRALSVAQEDLDALCSSFHVGSEHKDNPRCRGALERAVNLLRGSVFSEAERP
ncbi:MAG: hypothetical protein IJ240_07490 [Clostridia bacterium]|nr:hypothetical protein [Clostridia bacterium]